MAGSSYVWIEECEDEPRDIIPILDDFLAYEIREMGSDREGFEDAQKVSGGFYRVEYDWHMDQEYMDGFPCGPKYMVFDCIISLHPVPWLGRWLWFRHQTLEHWLDVLTAPFRKCWQVDFEYGNAGTSTSLTWLPSAIYYRWLLPESQAGWGPGSVRRMRRW